MSSRGVLASERFGELAAVLRSALGDRAGDWSGVSAGELSVREQNLDGATVVPGFVDNHVHVLGGRGMSWPPG